MSTFFHAAAVEPFICLFLLGKLALGGYGIFADALRRSSVSDWHLCKYFAPTGKTFRVSGRTLPEVLN